MIRQLIREMLLAERVYGAQAVVYHGSKAPPDVFVPALLNDTFRPGMGDGAMYGKALYCVYQIEGTKTGAGDYGKYIYKFKVNLYGFICFDPDVAQLVYKRPLTPVEQAQELGLDEALVEKLRGIGTEGLENTSQIALPASKFLKGKVKGLIFTGARDGKVAVIYDQTVATPFAYAEFDDEEWQPIDKNLLKPSLRRSASGDWEAEKYDVNFESLLAKLSKLPADKRTIKGDLNLQDEEITSLPAGLQVGGNLNLTYFAIKSLPVGLQVGGNLNLSNSWITLLPNDLRVGGDIDLHGSAIQLLPVDFQVEGTLNLRSTGITSLPAGLKVGGNLEIDGVSIRSFPAGLRVGGDLNFTYAGVTSLPADLQVGGSLNLRGSKIASFPADLQVVGDLDLSDTRITSLPAGLKVGGSLYLKGTGITSLPAGLRVGVSLNLRGSNIASLPADLQVSGYIYGFLGDKSQVPQHLKDKVR